MTVNKNNTHAKTILLGAIAAFTMLLVASCAKKNVATAKSETAPAETAAAAIVIPAETKGQVQIKRDVNSNYVIQINLRELEEVNKIEPTSKKAYIVWMNTDNKMVKNLGQINSNAGWLTDQSKASFEAVSEFKPTKIFITEEETASVTKPAIKVIWSTNKF